MTKRGEYRGLGKLGGSTLELALKYHVSAIRYGKHHQILQVRHVNFGWMDLKEYYLLQKLHDILPLVQTAITAGYQMKAWLWSTSVDVEILGSGVTVPLGALLVTLVGIEIVILAGENVDNAQQISALQAQLGPLEHELAILQSLPRADQGSPLGLPVGPPGHGGGPPGPTVPEAEASLIAQIQQLQAQVAVLQGATAKNQFQSFILTAAIALPFGEIYLMWHYATALMGGLGTAAADLGNFLAWLRSSPELALVIGPVPDGLLWLAEHGGFQDIENAINKLATSVS